MQKEITSESSAGLQTGLKALHTEKKNIQQANVLEVVTSSSASHMRWIVVCNTEEAELSFLLSFSWIIISRLGLCT